MIVTVTDQSGETVAVYDLPAIVTRTAALTMAAELSEEGYTTAIPADEGDND